MICVFSKRRIQALIQAIRSHMVWQEVATHDADLEDMELAEVGPGSTEITAIVPCYLPNEEAIIEKTILYILEHLEAPGELILHVVYNTPNDMPEIEERLRRMSKLPDLPRGRTLNVTRVPSSKSKAENLNYALGLISSPYVAIYDADHHPKADSLIMMYERLMRDKLDCVQGSTYIRNLEQGGFLGRFVDAEFFYTYFMAQPSARFLTHLAYFGGSNALWDRQALETLGFRENMQTEDIDVSFRAIVAQRRIDLCPEAQSGELAPASFCAFFRQRLRWTVGWDQVSVDLFGTFLDGKAGLRKNAGIFYYLYMRWFNIFAGFSTGVLLPILQLTGHSHHIYHGAFHFATSHIQWLLLVLLVSSALCMICEGIIQAHHKTWRWGQIPVLVLFVVGGSLYASYQLCMTSVSLCKIARGNIEGWYVSPRRQDDKTERSPRAASLMPGVDS
eukprot:CAMPEP_0178409076 /NCGR_PEP_ID=MMETSP0689_2-20121128/20273_1 /TAXON_ID=160604 /ORGANISM="Amphidinium massartii, Strain CS-259" /LENGTH=446 /DNA_ID=CAMNT_0020030201 /DNA_START=234 /DNA_END=1570 /DNA_ORIENTATION=-